MLDTIECSVHILDSCIYQYCTERVVRHQDCILGAPGLVYTSIVRFSQGGGDDGQEPVLSDYEYKHQQPHMSELINVSTSITDYKFN